jgi:hypothetical protein
VPSPESDRTSERAECVPERGGIVTVRRTCCVWPPPHAESAEIETATAVAVAADRLMLAL